MSGPRRQDGFTLLELIVAAGIMALIAVFSWRGLDTLIREREAIAASQAAIDVIQRSFARIERDALLASDAELDDGGTMRLVTGATPVEGTRAASVEYRLSAGALTRSVVGIDAAPVVVLDRVATLSIEAYVPSPGGGAWVRTKAAAVEPPSAATGPAGSGGTGAAAAGPVNGSSVAAPTANASLARGSAAPNVPGVARGSQQAGAPLVAAATGIRFVIDRTDGGRVVRAFMVGGA